MKKNIDWEAVQRDRDAGIPVSELVKKYDVSNPMIYTKTHGRTGATTRAANGKRRAGGAKKSNPVANGNSVAGLSTAELVAALRKRRDGLTAAIAALEGT